MDISKSKFIEKYKEDAIEAFKVMHPEWDEAKMEKIIQKMINESISVPECTIDNNYTQQRRDTNLLTIVDWSFDRKPLIAGNGTFYKNQHEAINPIANMLSDFLTTRKRLKKEMFALPDKTVRKYFDLDLQQSIEKINANSYYGASGMPSSAFYSTWSGPATTSTAQSVISTAYSTFEAFISDNFYFYDINECFNWLKAAMKKIKKDSSIDSWVKRKDSSDVYYKLKNMFIKWNDSFEPLLKDYLKNLDEVSLTRIYYFNKLEEFTRDHDEIINMNKHIINETQVYECVNKKDPDWESKIDKKFVGKFEDAEKYNAYVCKKAFMDPNDPPKEIIDDLDILSKYYLKYVYLRYSVFDRIYRLKNFGRKCVTVIDTDSNIIALDAWINFILGYCSDTKYMPRENLEFILVNTITYTLSKLIEDTLLSYGKDSNIPEEYRPIYNMKNEFFMRRLAIGNTKKRYLSLFKLREGNLLNPPKTDIKGFDFKKSGTSDICEEKFTKLAEDYVLKSEIIDVPLIISKLRGMEQDIIKSIHDGSVEYLPIGNAKDISAYKDPTSEQTVRAVFAWNFIYPDKMIELPTKVKLVKLNIFSPGDMSNLKITHPDIYDIIMDKIFNDTTGFFVTRKFDKKKHDEVTKVKGLQCIAIPMNETIPDWLFPYIDYNTMVNNIMSSFKSVMELLKMPYVSEGKTKNGISRKTNKLSNIIIF